jgi:hypothetical protein
LTISRKKLLYFIISNTMWQTTNKNFTIITFLFVISLLSS